MQHVLADARLGMTSPSSVSGRALTWRALAYYVWHRDQRVRPRPAHALVPSPVLVDADLDQLRDQAECYVRRVLAARLDRHARALRAGHALHALRLLPSHVTSPRPYRIGGLPGFYRGNVRAARVPAVPSTPAGSRGEVTLEQAREMAAAPETSGVELVPLTLEDVLQLHHLLRTEPVDDIAVAERVAELLRVDGSADTQLRRLLRRASRVEFVHLGRSGERTVAELLGREPLSDEVINAVRERWHVGTPRRVSGRGRPEPQ